MHYYEWNNLIGNLLFNPSKAGKPVLLYLTKEQISYAAVSAGYFETDQDAWEGFTRAIRVVCWKKDFVEVIKEFTKDSYGIYQERREDKIYQTTYPRFLALLSTAVLPLTNPSDTEWTTANYHDRSDAYSTHNNLPKISKQNRSLNWNQAWESLEEWSSIYKRGEIGWFRGGNINFNGHIYVGKPFSQCLIPPNALLDLPRAFVRMGWVPKQPLIRLHWHELLQQHGNSLGFRQAALQTIYKDQNLGDYALSILQERFNQWDGTLHTAAATAIKHDNTTLRRVERMSKEETAARFFLSFPDLDDTNGRFCWQYRVYTTLEAGYPDALQLDNHTFRGQFSGWSNSVSMPFQEKLQLNDPDNKWRVKWPDADIRLFERGQWHGLSNRLWIEVNDLSRVNKMYAICKPTAKLALCKWGQTFSPNQFKELVPGHDFNATDWPADYGLFVFERPTQGIPGTRFTLSTKAQLDWVNGLKVGYNIFYNRHRPLLRITNGDGSEQVTAFTEAGQQLGLQQLPGNPTVYQFVGELPEETIICRIADEKTGLSCQFKAADAVVQANDFPALPARNAFGELTESGVHTAYTGLAVSGLSNDRLSFMAHVFYPRNDQSKPLFQVIRDAWSLGDELLAFLTCRQESRPPQFFDAYETLLAEACSQGQPAMPANVSKLRRWALGWYDTLGYVDYDYDSGRIVVLSPTLIPVPCERGHRAILVGGRSFELIDRLRQLAEPISVAVSIEAQTDSSYLAPSVISLYTNHAFNGKQNSPIEQIARQLGISFLADERPAGRLLERSGSLTEYQATLMPEPEAETTTWTLRVFNPARLCFERPVSNQFDKVFTLVERQLNAYQFVHYLWIDGQSYRVDKNWGRFLILHHFGQQVIFRRSNQIAIPATLPLPRVLARGFALLSGKIPVREEHTFDGTKRAYLLYENAGNILSDNYIKKLGQQIRTTHL